MQDGRADWNERSAELRSPCENFFQLVRNAEAGAAIPLRTIMSYLSGPDRSEIQLLPPCLDDYVAAGKKGLSACGYFREATISRRSSYFPTGLSPK
jgi:hypothetical protein